MNCARCCEKILKSRRNSLFRMPSAALRKTSWPRLQVSTKPLRIEITSLLFIYECHPLLMKGQLLYHLVGHLMLLLCHSVPGRMGSPIPPPLDHGGGTITSGYPRACLALGTTLAPAY